MKNPQNFVDCETVVFFANARDAGSNSNEWSRASIETRKGYAYGASRLQNREEKTTIMQCTKFAKIRSHENFMPHVRLLSHLSRDHSTGRQKRQRAHYTWKSFDNATLFLRLGLQSTLIRHENRAFRKHSTNPEEFENAAVFVGTEKILKTELFENDDVTIITWLPWPSSPQTQIQNGRLRLRFKIPPA